MPPAIRTLLQQLSRQGSPRSVSPTSPPRCSCCDHQAGVARQLATCGCAAATHAAAVAARRGTRRPAALGRLPPSPARACGSRRAPRRLRVVRTTITTSGSTALALQGGDRDIAITPDGSRVVYRGNNQLLVRALNQLEPTVLSGLGAPRGVFISPDGQWVGFFDGQPRHQESGDHGRAASDDCARRTADRAVPPGAPDETIIFATDSPATGLQRVSAAGGEPTVLTKPDRERGEGDHVWPEFLPGGEAVLFTITPAPTAAPRTRRLRCWICRPARRRCSSVAAATRTTCRRGISSTASAGTLRAVAFDLGRLEVVGTPAPVLEGVVTTSSGAADVAVAANGSLVYVPGGRGGGQQTVVSVDRQGRASPLPGLPLDSYRDVRVSPDGARLALATQDDVWIYDFTRATLSRLTTDPASDRSPLWTPDGQRIVFTSRRAGYPELFWRPADGTGSDERFLARAKDLTDLRANGWSADGRQLLFTEVSRTVVRDRADRHRAPVRREGAGEKRLLHHSRPSLQTDAGWPTSPTCPVEPRSMSSGIRSSETGNRSRRAAAVSHSGHVTAGNCSSAAWTAGRCLRSPCNPGRRSSPGVRRCCSNSPCSLQGVGHRPYDIAPDGRFLIIRSGQAETGGGRRRT